MTYTHRSLATYVVPGPTVYAGGSTKSAGAGCVGCESTCTAGSGPTGTASSVPQATVTGGLPGCAVAKFAQCGGVDYKGCTTCAVSDVRNLVYPVFDLSVLTNS